MRHVVRLLAACVAMDAEAAAAGPVSCAALRDRVEDYVADGIDPTALREAVDRLCGASPRAADRRGPACETAVVGGTLTSPFGWRDYPLDRSRRQFHSGVDIGVPSGTSVHAVASGRVITARERGGRGRLVEIEHVGGVRTSYAHLSRIEVREGAWVRGGDRVGLSGRTGRATGPHLHFSVSVDGNAVDPFHHPLGAWLEDLRP